MKSALRILIALLLFGIYSTVYAQQSQSEPYVIYGYLKVFPCDLGTFDSEPQGVISHLNQSRQYGYGTWRLPSNEELQLMRANNIVGSGVYMTFEKRNEKGIVRLVTDKEKGRVLPAGYVDLGLPSGTLWKDKNEDGYYSYDQAVSKFGKNLPTKDQIYELYSACTWDWKSNGYKVVGPNGNSIFLPADGYFDCDGKGPFGGQGNYWSSSPYGKDESLASELKFTYFEPSTHLGGKRCCRFSVRLVHNY